MSDQYSGKSDEMRQRLEQLEKSTFIYRELEPEEREMYRQRMADKYTEGDTDFTFLERLSLDYPRFIINEQRGMLWMDEFLEGQETILFFADPERRPEAILFENGADIMRLMRSYYGSSVCLTNRDAEFLISDFEGWLHCIGTAGTWLEKRLAWVYDELQIPKDSLQVQDVNFKEHGKTVEVACVYDNSGTKQQAKIILRDCYETSWKPHTLLDEEPTTIIDFVLIRESLDWIPRLKSLKLAIVRTNHYDLRITHKEFAIEKDW